MGICADCGKPSLARDEYIVRSNLWMACGMGAWAAGYLHRQCVEARLGRKLTDADLLVQVVEEKPDRVIIEVHPDYLTSPECRPTNVTQNCLAPPPQNLPLSRTITSDYPRHRVRSASLNGIVRSTAPSKLQMRISPEQKHARPFA